LAGDAKTFYDVQPGRRYLGDYVMQDLEKDKYENKRGFSID
jgi:hypothetical protein